MVHWWILPLKKNGTFWDFVKYGNGTKPPERTIVIPCKGWNVSTCLGNSVISFKIHTKRRHWTEHISKRSPDKWNFMCHWYSILIHAYGIRKVDTVCTFKENNGHFPLGLRLAARHSKSEQHFREVPKLVKKSKRQRHVSTAGGCGYYSGMRNAPDRDKLFWPLIAIRPLWLSKITGSKYEWILFALILNILHKVRSLFYLRCAFQILFSLCSTHNYSIDTLL